MLLEEYTIASQKANRRDRAPKRLLTKMPYCTKSRDMSLHRVTNNVRHSVTFKKTKSGKRPGPETNQEALGDFEVNRTVSWVAGN